MAEATYKTLQSAVAQEFLMRANVILGLPKIGKVAAGCTNVGEGVHVVDSDVRTDALTEFSYDSVSKNTFIHVTDAFRPTLDAVKAAAQARIDAMSPLSFDTEIVALTEQALEFGDLFQLVFNPRQIANCNAWGRADTGVIQVADVISQWRFYTQAGPAPFTQAVAGARPTWIHGGPGGRDGISFDGGDWLDVAGATFNQDCTVYVVAQPANFTGGKTVLVSADNGMHFRFTDAMYEAFAGNPSAVTADAAPAIYEVVVAGGLSSMGVNGSGNPFVNLGPNDGLGGLRIGARNDETQGFEGSLYEVIYYARALTVQERAVVRTGLAVQYGIAGV